ncbi:hypothetical protein ACG-C91_0006 [Escherichia phage vB_EcoP_ACG-C91]|nr:hypothetical protein D860_gp49 [Escherichia phage vB_EcoP_ACG-C91]AFH19831.1 hypothetical protein ACG-C91_0006 [Escherichia phage vB_EcoP_ACG-C91]
MPWSIGYSHVRLQLSRKDKAGTSQPIKAQATLFNNMGSRFLVWIG